MNKLDITSKEISSLSEMDSLFENYCSQNWIVLDFTKDAKYNAYLDGHTSNSFCWFMNGIFRSIGNEHDKGLL